MCGIQQPHKFADAGMCRYREVVLRICRHCQKQKSAHTEMQKYDLSELRAWRLLGPANLPHAAGSLVGK